MKIIAIDKYGIWFTHNGDEVAYVWPWFIDRRKCFKKRFYSISFESYFESLEKLDKTWDDYFEACKELESEDE